MTFGLFFLILAQTPIPLKVYFIFGAIIVLIVAILILAYRSFLRSPEPTEDDYSALHIGGNPAAAPVKPAKTPPPQRVVPVTAPLPIPDRTATLRAPAAVDRPIEKKVVGPAIETLPVPEPIVSRVEPAVAPPLPIPEPVRTRIESVPLPDAPPPLPPRDVYSPLKEELPQSGRRSLSSPRVFAPSAPRPEPVPPAIAPVTTITPPVMPVQQSQPLQAAPTSKFASQASRPRVESEVFGSLTEVQKRESKSSRATLLILLVAVIVIFTVGYMKVPLFHDTIVGAYDRVTGRAAEQEKIAQSPKIEATQKVTYTTATLFIDGVVRNISEDNLENLYAEVSVNLANGKVSETRLIPIYEGTPQAKASTEPGKENRTMPPSHGGYYKLELPGSMYTDAQLKRILRQADGSEVLLQKH
jgi:hypothetical protein